MADIPGIIEGASGGKGLGLLFLKHIERTNFLLFVLDTMRQMSLKEQFIILKKELKSFSKELSKRSFGVMISKIDSENLGLAKELKENIKDLENFLQDEKPMFILKVSSLDKTGLKELKFKLLEQVKNKN